MEIKPGLSADDLRRWPPRYGRSAFLLSPQLGDRLYNFILIRFLVAIVIIPGALLARHVVGIENLDVRGLSILAGLLLLFNTAMFLIVSPYRKCPERALAANRLLKGVMNGSIVIDFLILTGVLWIMGGSQSPLQAFFIFHVIIASMLLSTRAAITHAIFGYFLFAMLVIGAWRGWFPARYPYGAIASAGPVDGRYVFTVLAVQGMLIVLTALLVTSLIKVLNEGKELLIRMNQELERISSLRRDFLRLTLHNLHSPISAACMFLENLRQGFGGPLNPQQTNWVERSQKRLGELTKFLHDLEFLALLESESLDRYFQEIDLRPLLEDLFQENQDLAQSRNQSLELLIQAEQLKLKGIARLVREAVVNYIINAIKYTPPGGRITIKALRHGNWARVEVEDNGPGIRPEDQSRLFQEFVRLEQESTEQVQAPGSGLGLYIVRKIAELHNGRVELISQPQRGSTFAIEFPLV